MTPAQLRSALARLGLSQVGAARLYGIDPSTMRRYLSGRQPVPAWMEYALAGTNPDGSVLSS